MFARREAKSATTVIRTSNVEYVDLWRAGQLDVDFVVCSELETAHAISRIIGVPAARQTDVFAEGQVQIVEFDVEESSSPDVVGVPLREAKIPRDSKVAAIIRGDEMLLPGGEDVIRAGDRIVVIGSPDAAQAWSALLAPEGATVRDVVIYGAGRVGSAIARVLIDQGIGVRLVEASREKARSLAEALPRRASTTRPASIPTSSSGSASDMRTPRSSRCETTRRTSMPRRSPRFTASSSRSASRTSRCRRRPSSMPGSTSR